MDALSELVALLRSHRSYFAGLKAGGDWALDFPAPDGIKFNAVVQGQCWLEVEGELVPTRLYEGDCFLLTQNRPWKLSSHMALEGRDAREVYSEAVGGIATLGDTVDLFLIGGRFTYGDEARLLLEELPPVVRISARSDQASVLRWCLERLAMEHASPKQGAALMTEHLAQMMLVQILRLYQSSLGASTVQALNSSDSSVSCIGQSLGYQSDSAFSSAFKRVMNCSPREYRERNLHKETRDERYRAVQDSGQRH